MFKIGSILSSAFGELEDAAKTKFALTSLGYYDDTVTGLAPYPEAQLFSSIKAYQKDKGLKVDGYMRPDGETQASIRKSLEENEKAGNAFQDFKRNFDDMNATNFVRGDEYFHCKANYEATSRGWGGKLVAIGLGIAKEVKDLPKWGMADVNEDIQINYYGRKAASSGKFKSAKEACARYRPEGLPDEY